jgi:2-dehydropantoate 2-reductase
VFLVGLSETTTSIRKPIEPIRSNRETRVFLHEAMREVVAVGRAEGVELPEDSADNRLAFCDSLPAEITSSMHHDIEKGSRLEVERLSGDVVKRGKKAGDAAPVIRAIFHVFVLHADGAT